MSVDLFVVFLSALLAGLSAILTSIALAAASRYRDGRLGSVAAALVLFTLLGALSLLHELSPLYGGGFEVDPIPLILAVGAVALLYVSLVRRRAPPESGKHG
ncbi:MAG: hypothetical protein L3J93_00750 [Thermoplasmata archaeon]|nr:hypothetical protein [Thermoplasmata archaeon]